MFLLVAPLDDIWRPFCGPKAEQNQEALGPLDFSFPGTLKSKVRAPKMTPKESIRVWLFCAVLAPLGAMARRRCVNDELWLWSTSPGLPVGVVDCFAGRARL